MSDDATNTSPPKRASEADDSRRGFLKVGVGVLGAGLAGVVVAPAVRALLWPLADGVKVTSGGEDFVVVGNRDQFGETPIKVDIYADRVDAWNRTKNVKIGSAWVVVIDEKLHAFSSVCPHLGCAVDYDGELGKFKCPCHDSAFGLDGAREEGPSPRGLDQLEFDEPKEGKLLAIRYERFKQGVEAKVKV
ncbi:QcrA and Rieske domain-containing protein [Enhygromyxa salina]|uniref:Cytochrome b6-f complex iron-sulfur subunit 1 n=1 Tax=Enhygromyxa salina TaxID=215803 RepID=A0A2S9YQM4_9BACT|nr:Rieske 2Fe-2S domain-containing protein [Enhygromyxa salina]PRQ07405.1 Cytochrome b6-f complex iron-sulfur subunit 1 [Enhygromyxa salina]